MKVLTEEEQRDHYNATLIGGLLGGSLGVAAGTLGVWGASRRYPAFRNLTLPLRAFLITSTGTFSAIVAADSYGRHYEQARHPDRAYQDEAQTIQQQLQSQKTQLQRTREWLAANRYGVVFGSWVASMTAAFGIVGRNPYLTGQQKLAQTRVYAQGLTLAVIIISLAFETSDSTHGKGRWETVKVLDPDDPEHKRTVEKKIHHERYAGEDQWRDMVEAEEERIREREQAMKKEEEEKKKDRKAGKAKGEVKQKSGEEADRGAKVEEAKDQSVNAP